MDNITLNIEDLIIDTRDADRHVLAPAPGDLIYLDDGRHDTVMMISWNSQGGKLTTATVTTGSFVCSLGEVAYVEKAASPVVENELAEVI